MKKLVLLVWLLLPVGALAYHLGPGQEHVRGDRAASAFARGESAAKAARAIAEREGDDAARATWAEAAQAFEDALAELPPGLVDDARAIRLEKAKAEMYLSKLPEVRGELEELVDEMVADPSADPKTLAGARNALANARYYATWLMRLEGAPREEWEREIEGSRQIYRLLAEDAERAGDVEVAQRSREDLEAAIKLERMDIGELQGLPLPSQ